VDFIFLLTIHVDVVMKYKTPLSLILIVVEPNVENVQTGSSVRVPPIAQVELVRVENAIVNQKVLLRQR
jgi:hypothetical protein